MVFLECRIPNIAVLGALNFEMNYYDIEYCVWKFLGLDLKSVEFVINKIFTLEAIVWKFAYFFRLLKALIKTFLQPF